VFVLHEEPHAAARRELPLHLGILERDGAREQVPPRDLHAHEDRVEALPQVAQPLPHAATSRTRRAFQRSARSIATISRPQRSAPTAPPTNTSQGKPRGAASHIPSPPTATTRTMARGSRTFHATYMS